jgi:hypothetical protein
MTSRLCPVHDARNSERPVPVPGRALGVLYSVLHGTVWHPYSGER